MSTDARFVFVNNAMETFTPSASGALATHIYECCTVAARQGVTPHVITRAGEAEAFAWPGTTFVGRPSRLEHGPRSRTMRKLRGATGWGDPGERGYARAARDVIEQLAVAPSAVLCQNNPSLAAYLATTLRHVRVIHHFQNQLLMTANVLDRYRNADVVSTAVSPFTADWLLERYAIRCAAVVPNGVDLAHFHPGRRRPTNGPVRLGFVGRTGWEKAPDLLLSAAQLLAARGHVFEVQIVGSNHWGRFTKDDYQVQLSGCVDALAAQGIAVHRLGHISRPAIPDAFARADVHVTTSRWEEPFGMVTLEAMASGCAVVATATGGTTEIVRGAGLLVPKDDPVALADALEPLIVDAGLRATVAKRCLARAQAYQWESVWRKWLTLAAGDKGEATRGSERAARAAL